ncbi:diacylglycerol kinase family lipid kinase [soil metagenome]
MHIILLHNPGAGQGDVTAEQLVEALAQRGHEVSYHSTKKESCEQAIVDAAELVAVAGGDGTVRAAARCVAGSDRLLMILPCGTANNIATQLGVCTGALETIRRMDLLNERRVDAGLAEGPWGEEIFFEGVGFGMLPQIIPFLKAEAKGRKFADRYQAIAHHRELFAQLLKSFKPGHWRVQIDDEPVEGDFFLIEALNIGSVGPWLEIAPGADPGDGKLDVVRIPARAKKTLAKLLRGEIESLEAVQEFDVSRAARVELEWDGSAVHIDSDIWAVGQQGLGKIKQPPSPFAAGVRLSLNARALRVLTPANSTVD